MADERFKVAAVQMLSFEGEHERNLERMLARIAEAAEAGARLIVFPEASNNGYFFKDRADAHRKATPIPGPFTEALGREARKHGVWVVAGMFEQGDNDDVFNCAVLIGPDGELVGKYQKNFFIKADKRWFTIYPSFLRGDSKLEQTLAWKPFKKTSEHKDMFSRLLQGE